MKTIEILYALEEIDENQLYQAKPKPKTVHISRWIRLCAACLILMLTAGTLFYNLQNRIPLSDASRAVSARYVHSAPQIRTANSLIELTEEELFTYFNTAIFEGTIVSLHNIEIRFNGEKAYRAIAEIEIDTVYWGTCREGEIVSILLPCPIADNYHVTDMEIVSQTSAGMRGIFMPIHYDKIDFGNKTAHGLSCVIWLNMASPMGAAMHFSNYRMGCHFPDGLIRLSKMRRPSKILQSIYYTCCNKYKAKIKSQIPYC